MGLAQSFYAAYEDHVLRRITAEQFRMLSADYNTEQKMLQETTPEKEARLEKLKASAANAEVFIEKTKRFTTIDKLTPELVCLFIQRIEIGERVVKYSRSSEQSVKIIYRDVRGVKPILQIPVFGGADGSVQSIFDQPAHIGLAHLFGKTVQQKRDVNLTFSWWRL